MSKSSYHMVHYRRNERTNWPVGTPTLENLCRAALGTTDAAGLPLWERAVGRTLSFSDPEPKQILLNKVADLQDAIYGEMCLVQNKDLQAIIQMTATKKQLSELTTAEIYDLSEREAPTGSQFLRGLLYWIVIGDHIFFVKLQGMTADLMQDYLNWLVSSGGSSATPPSISLKAQFDPSIEKIGELRSLRVSGKSSPPMSVAPTQESENKGPSETARRVADAFREWEQAIPIVRALFGEAKTDSLLKSLSDGEYLAVDATVKIRGRRAAESRAKLKELANSLSDMSDADVRIEGKDGTVSDGDAILRTRMPFTLPHEGSSILDFDNVADQLQEVYRRFVTDRKIQS